MAKRRIATLAAAVAAAGMVVGAAPAGAATAHNLMLYVNSPSTHIQIVPEEGSNACVPVTAGKWTNARFRVYEGKRYSFQAMVFDNPQAGRPCGGGSRYLGPSVNSPLTIPPTKSSNYWEKISLG